MSIVIKEIFPADSISKLVEKLNFNFDQIMLSGGGPPGPIGPQGQQGIPGPIGPRGSYWWVGSTASLGFTALEFDSVLEIPTGDVFQYNGTDWDFTGLNLKGPTGDVGLPGGSFELNLFLGGTYNASPSSLVPMWRPDWILGATTADNGNINFFIPNNIEKNVLFLGDPEWSFTNLINLTQSPAGSTGIGLGPKSTPKLTIIQNSINPEGFGGISIGAYGITGGTGGNIVPFGSTGDLVDARDFFYAGIASILDPDDDEIKHVFKSRTNSIDYEIQAGTNNTYLGTEDPKVLIRSKRIKFVNHSNEQILDVQTDRSIFKSRVYINEDPSSLDFNLSVRGVSNFKSLNSSQNIEILPGDGLLFKGTGIARITNEMSLDLLISTINTDRKIILSPGDDGDVEIKKGARILRQGSSEIFSGDAELGIPAVGFNIQWFTNDGGNVVNSPNVDIPPDECIFSSVNYDRLIIFTVAASISNLMDYIRCVILESGYVGGPPPNWIPILELSMPTVSRRKTFNFLVPSGCQFGIAMNAPSSVITDNYTVSEIKFGRE